MGKIKDLTKQLIEQMEERKKVMQHFLDGGKIEVRQHWRDDWEPCLSPRWFWQRNFYRIEKEKKYFYKYRYQIGDGRWFEAPGYYQNDKDFYYNSDQLSASDLNGNQPFKRDWGSKIDEDGEKC